MIISWLSRLASRHLPEFLNSGGSLDFLRKAPGAESAESGRLFCAASEAGRVGFRKTLGNGDRRASLSIGD